MPSQIIPAEYFRDGNESYTFDIYVGDYTDANASNDPVKPIEPTNPTDPTSPTDSTNTTDPATLLFRWIIDNMVTAILIIVLLYLGYAYWKGYIKNPNSLKAGLNKYNYKDKDSSTLDIIE